MSKHNFKPARVEDFDFTGMANSSMWVLSDWMGCRRQVAAQANKAAQTAFLKARCLENLSRAQDGYDIIILGKHPAEKGAVAVDVEKRMVELLTDVVVKHRDGMDEAAVKAVSAAAAKISGSLADEAKKAIKAAAESARPMIIQDGTKVRKVKGVLPPEFERMVQLGSARVPILLVGPAGCGKTYLAEKLGDALGLETSDQSCSEGMSESVFNGLLLPIGKAGAFEHVTSPFMKRYEKGGVMLLDEMDAGDANVFTYVNKAVANDSYTVPQRWTNPVVKKHADFVLIAAANTYGHGSDAMYVGRNQLDAATIDRFKIGMITMDYSRLVEESLGSADLCAWAWKIRDAIRARKLRRIMSTRTIKSLQKMVDMYKWGQKEWEEAYFTGWTAEERNAVQGAM